MAVQIRLGPVLRWKCVVCSSKRTCVLQLGFSKMCHNVRFIRFGEPQKTLYRAGITSGNKKFNGFG